MLGLSEPYEVVVADAVAEERPPAV